MSSDDEIRQVYEGDIYRQSKVVFSHGGYLPFIADSSGGYSVQELFYGLLTDEDMAILNKLLTDD